MHATLFMCDFISCDRDVIPKLWKDGNLHALEFKRLGSVKNKIKKIIQNLINETLKYIKIKQLFQIYIILLCFRIFYQINAALLSIRDFKRNL